MSPEDPPQKGFWSRRKEAVRQAEEAEKAQEQAALDARQRAELEEKSDEEILEELGLPDPDTLQKDDDFSAFLGRTVPERLRRRALRRLWVSNPVLANLDGLNDYEEDFTDAASAMDVVRTAYKVGRGFLMEEPEEKAQDTAQQVPVEETDEMLSGQSETAALQQQNHAASQRTYDQNGKTSIHLTQSDEAVHSSDIGTIDSDETALVEPLGERLPRRRRMRFDYE
ncbi:DUF3306 domain-containing protein [Roseibium sediminicola]|uniref:DUF3306 domain-containing protein n=1 Tax=Roseibium sediminicola TaxID=2933272 RepID=A0ABT0GU40_9HYPH|nr:DUF3306 domain-containing protein [Roseibium sp. CAU 1639]MCK7612946.1 DUF3306 domain-containing protein [Roseibium sp. CAU 1639]